MIHGGIGNDSLKGGGGRDLLNGEAENDHVFGGAGMAHLIKEEKCGSIPGHLPLSSSRCHQRSPCQKGVETFITHGAGFQFQATYVDLVDLATGEFGEMLHKRDRDVGRPAENLGSATGVCHEIQKDRLAE